MTTITVNTNPAYEVRITEKSTDACRDTAAQIAAFGGRDRRYCLITDETVNRLYGDSMMDGLQGKGLDVCRLVFPAGEGTKNIDSLAEALEFLAENQLTRRDMVIAFGGGVIGDLAGFTAATYLRGIPYVQVPTTLLACVDSSVGGKTAVDLKAGKNLAGAFWQPGLVIIQPGWLDSLTPHQILDGMAEIIKCGVIGDSGLFGKIREMAGSLPQSDGESVKAAVLHTDFLTACITAAVNLKRRLVEEDEHDTGSRQLLNLGHTIGHAVEGASGMTVTHGHAVACGMYLIARGSLAEGWSDEDTAHAIGDLLQKLGYPLSYPYGADALYSYILTDKKRRDDYLSLVIPETIGHCRLQRIGMDQVPGFLRACLA